MSNDVKIAVLEEQIKSLGAILGEQIKGNHALQEEQIKGLREQQRAHAQAQKEYNDTDIIWKQQVEKKLENIMEYLNRNKGALTIIAICASWVGILVAKGVGLVLSWVR